MELFFLLEVIEHFQTFQHINIKKYSWEIIILQNIPNLLEPADELNLTIISYILKKKNLHVYNYPPKLVQIVSLSTNALVNEQVIKTMQKFM